MINSVQIPKAYSEVYCFLNALGDSYIKKIPSTIYNIIKDNRDESYNPIFNNNETIEKGKISKEALALISALNLKYWCKSDEERASLKTDYVKNVKIEEEKYSYNNIFKNNTNIENNVEQEKIIEHTAEQISSKPVALVEYKENFITKIINKIKNFFFKFK